MRERRRPDERVNEAVALVQQAAALIETIVSIECRARAAEENSAAAAALTVVYLMRPRVGCQRLEALGEPLLERNRKPVVETAHAVRHFVNRAKRRVRAGIEIDRRRVRSDRIPISVVDSVGECP